VQNKGEDGEPSVRGLAPPPGEDPEYVVLFSSGSATDDVGMKHGLAAISDKTEQHAPEHDNGQYVTIFPSGHGFTTPRHDG